MIIHILDVHLIQLYMCMVILMYIILSINKLYLFYYFHNQMILTYHINMQNHIYIHRVVQQIVVNIFLNISFLISIYFLFIHNFKHTIFYLQLYKIHMGIILYNLLNILVHFYLKHKMYKYYHKFYYCYLMNKHINQNSYKRKYFLINISILDHIMYNY